MIFNALVSGDLRGGIPSNKITVLAGEEATGKTFFLLGTIKHFLKTNPKGRVVLFESESAITKQMLLERDIDTTRIAILPVSTIQEWRTQAVRVLDKYIEQNNSETPLLMGLDSLGMLSTDKEAEDVSSGSDKRDMTRAPAIRAAFRVLTLKLGRANVPMIVTNHTYQVIGSYVPTKEMGGGQGLKYSASSIIYLGKKKDRDDDSKEVVGNLIRCTLVKGRLTKENKTVTVKLSYDTGLDPYYGLTELAIKHGVFKKTSRQIELLDGSRVFEKKINENPELFFTADVLEKLQEAAGKEFLYGSAQSDNEENLDNEDVENDS
jgi:RecA/RadA recombinase